jgi:hypothetical protein
MAGWITNGLPTVHALVENGVTISPVPLTNLPSVSGLVPVDVVTLAGAQPITVGATPFQIAAAAAELISNVFTSTVHAATANVTGGLITTEALTTAAGATYTFTLTNSLLVAGAAAPEVFIKNGTNTAGVPQVTSITNAVGSTVIVVTNIGTAAFNGTMLIGFHI